MIIMAFDLGSNMAFAVDDWEHNVGHRAFKGDRIQRAADTLLWLRDLRDTYDPATVVYERPFARGQAATRALWGIAGLIEATFGNHAAVLDITPSEIKKFAFGHGDAKKSNMLDAARAMGYTGDNEHEADAFCLLRMAEATLTKEPAQ